MKMTEKRQHWYRLNAAKYFGVHLVITGIWLAMISFGDGKEIFVSTLSIRWYSNVIGASLRCCKWPWIVYLIAMNCKSAAIKLSNPWTQVPAMRPIDWYKKNSNWWKAWLIRRITIHGAYLKSGFFSILPQLLNIIPIFGCTIKSHNFPINLRPIKKSGFQSLHVTISQISLLYIFDIHIYIYE